METVDVKEFTKQLIADRCSALIESANMLPQNVLCMIKRAHEEYRTSPNDHNFNNIKELISQTKYVEESVEYKDFNRRIVLIAFKLIMGKSRDLFPQYKPFLETACKRLETINPDMKSSPKAMLQHYHQCMEEMEHPKPDDHYMISFAKEIVTKIFYDAVADMTTVAGSAVTISPAVNATKAPLVLNRKRPQLFSVPAPVEKKQKHVKLVKPVFSFATVSV
ncbi:PlxyGVORF40-like protein [Hyphantria cunea granulovirus]|uniref:PlxyGVORF40-like protein n=1 Tax=Hyphantria cunea granulovirus TaxID=307448 RepID=A0AAE6D0J2_9BBAC|nr:PlxyGVORF40-like protein [Hyphantria cunea granulovirus]QBQ01594.1 PlxyGVORF40-like protein [Hyphantria cunea granulovirus]